MDCGVEFSICLSGDVCLSMSPIPVDLRIPTELKVLRGVIRLSVIDVIVVHLCVYPELVGRETRGVGCHHYEALETMK